MNIILKAENISFERAGRKLFNHFNFELREKECLQVVGPNGSGKTTLLRLMAGLLEPDQGKFAWSSIPSISYLGHRLGIKDSLTVLENLRFSFQEYDEKKAFYLINRFLITPYTHQLCRCLSQGQKQRVALIRLLLSSTQCWIVDEPIAGLDKEGKQLIQHCFAEHIHQGGSLIVSTHHLLDAMGVPMKTINLSELS